MMTTQPQYTEEESKILTDWFDQLINTHSEFLNATIGTPEQVIQHVQSANQQGYRLAVVRPQTPIDDWSTLPRLVDEADPHNVVIEEAAESSYEAWDRIRPTNQVSSYQDYIESCRVRNEAIAAARQAWKDAIIEREAALKFLDADVTTKRNAYQLAKDVPVPVAPAGLK